jgi:hypothetical protein
MKDILIGDLVQTVGAKFEPVYTFAHSSPESSTVFLQISTDWGNKLEVTGNHLVFVQDRGMVPASTVQVGEVLRTSTDEGQQVFSIDVVTTKGIFAPLTPSGTILVDNVLASTYVSLKEDDVVLKLGGISLGLTYHSLEHAALFPLRLRCYYLGHCLDESYSDDGIASWAQVPHRFAQWYLKQKAGLLSAMLSVMLAIALSVMAVIEVCLAMPSSGTAVSLSFVILTFARLGHLRMKAKHL